MRRVVRLRPGEEERWDRHARTCLFWQAPPGQRSPVDPCARKGAWVSRVAGEWGSCGFVLHADNRVVGHVLYAPTGLLPGTRAMPTPPADPEVVLLASLWLEPYARGAAGGKLLLHHAVRDLVARQVTELEVLGTRRGGTAGGCQLDVDYLARVGFVLQRDHPVTPRMRMDLRSTLRVRDELGLAWDRLVGVVRPPPQPAPGSRATRSLRR